MSAWEIRDSREPPIPGPQRLGAAHPYAPVTVEASKSVSADYQNIIFVAERLHGLLSSYTAAKPRWKTEAEAEACEDIRLLPPIGR